MILAVGRVAEATLVAAFSPEVLAHPLRARQIFCSMTGKKNPHARDLHL